MAPPVTWSVRALGRARRRLLRGRGRVCLPWSRSSPSPGSGGAEFVVFWGQGRVRTLGSGEVEFVVFRGRALGRARRSSSSSGAEAESEPWGRARWSSSSSGAEASPSPGVGRGGVHRLPGPRRVRALGSGEAELPMALEAGLGCCPPHSVERHSSRSDVGGAVLLSGRSVERRSDCGHFSSVD
jgi:hypothetical protein